MRYYIVAMTFLALTCFGQDRTWKASGKVVDGGRNPVVGAQVGWGCSVRDGKRQFFSGSSCLTDESGAFAVEAEVWSEHMTLLAFSKDGQKMGMKRLGTEADVSSIQIVLGPTVEVTGRVYLPALDRVPWIGFQVSAGPGDEPFLSYYSQVGKDGTVANNGRFSIRLPKGKYKYKLYGMSFLGKRGRFAVGRHDVDLGTIHVDPTVISKRTGKKMPEWTVSASRGLDLSATKVADFRGKWVLVEFWGYW